MIAGQTTFSVKFCVASGGMPLVAVNISGNVPVCVAVPPSTRVAGVNVTPVGSAPVCDTVGAGKPVVVTVNDAGGADGEGRRVSALVIAGGALTTTVKLCVAFGSVPLVAVSVTGKDPLCVGVPDSSPADDNVRPVGSMPVVTLTVGAGKPVITTWNVVPAVFSTNVAVLRW